MGKKNRTELHPEKPKRDENSSQCQGKRRIKESKMKSGRILNFIQKMENKTVDINKEKSERVENKNDLDRERSSEFCGHF
jgi:hypothetical protein